MAVDSGRDAFELWPVDQGVDRYLTRLDECRDDPGFGWLAFAAGLLLILGAVNLIEGLAVVGNPHFLAERAHYLAGSLPRWGWGAVLFAVVALAAGFGVLVQSQLSRWAGVVILALNGGVQVLTLPAYLIWSLSTIALGVVAVYGLVAYGKPGSASGRVMAFSPDSSRGVRFGVHGPRPKTAGSPVPAGELDRHGVHGSGQWRRWYRSSQKVNRTWNEWLAADGRQDATLYGLCIAALQEEEEAAAEVQRLAKPAEGKREEAVEDLRSAGRGGCRCRFGSR